MAALIFNIIFFIVSATSSILTRIIFTTTAYLLVLLIQAFKFPGEAIKTGMDTFGEIVKSCFEFIFDLILDLGTTIVSAFIDILFEYMTGSSMGMVSVISVLLEKTKEGFVTDLPDVAQGFAEMIFTMVVDFWNNYKDVFQYVTENA